MKSATARIAGGLILAAALSTGGCGGSSKHANPIQDISLTGIRPSAAQLESMLLTELDRLGVDPDKTTAAAPRGEDNRVFFLTAYVQDPDGSGPQVPTAVRLQWTERCTGDYNQDGLVGVSDLTPLGQRFNEQVDYYNPEQRGFDCWPVGPPLDDGGAGAGNPPVSGSPADNWRLARIDGNTDGLIGVSDITPIAQHWQERLSGYRVYRIRPGEPGFSALPNADDPGLGYTVPRVAAFPPGSTSADPLRPVHYEYLDQQLGAASGWYEYYVVPYDASADEEGMPSHPVPADMGSGGGGSQPPHAIVMPDVDHGEFPLTVTFDAAASWDLDGVIVKYEWDMDGDLSGWEYDSTPATTLQMTYNSADTQHQWVRVTDNDGLTAVALAKVSVGAAGGNLPPVARLFPAPPEGEVPLQVTWNAGESFDHDGTIAKYEWDMDGDSTTWEWDSGPTATMDITYNTGGPHTQYVRVTDDGGLSDTAFGTVHAFGGANQSPTAAFTSNITEGDPPLLIDFDASGSFDPDGNIQQYEWDFDGDTVIDDTAAAPTVSHIYTTPGFFSATLTVTDDLGAQDSASVNITVHGWATFQVDSGPTLGTDVSLALVNGQPAIAYSLDDWVNDMELRYIRAEDAYGAFWPSSPVVVHDGGTTNRVGTSLSLTVVNGNPAIAYHDASAGTLLYRRATDLNGASWPASSVVVDGGGGGAGGHCSLAVLDGQPAIAYLHISQDDLMYVRAGDQDGTAWATPITVNSTAGSARYTTLLEYSTTSVVPLISHFNINTQEMLFERGSDPAGSSWVSPTPLCAAGDCNDSASLATINGLPATVYFGIDNLVPGLNYRRATDNTAFNWDSVQQLVTGGENGLRPCLAEVGGNPAVAYKTRVIMSQDELRYIAATDVNGGSWGSVEIVDAVHSAGHDLSLIDISGHAAIAYTHNGPGELWYAFRY